MTARAREAMPMPLNPRGHRRAGSAEIATGCVPSKPSVVTMEMRKDARDDGKRRILSRVRCDRRV